MIRVDIETIIMAAGPVPSVIVLRERGNDDASDAPLRALSIQTGSYEAAAIGRGIDGDDGSRPITHDLMVDTIRELGGKLERVEINRVDAPIFYATVVLADQDSHEKRVDARPSDALALAVRSNAPIYVEDDVMNRAGNVSYRGEEDSEKELERFDEFARSVSPDDF
ncbi:bifunctional nuclease family protein [Collinsella tanakaei]|uniref:bifunctional nuclease family protein n=1 Tax=Collinsella tanakaei TaxID=626935 RepID=UPI0025A385D3|nr:bifunctional nuclease family protein [Collinsella tanakaei]MDM8302287.1 bifunctional nuclease family protein [Collinsella tanakaei]